MCSIAVFARVNGQCRSYGDAEICGTYVGGDLSPTISYASTAGSKYYNSALDRTSTLTISGIRTDNCPATGTISASTTGGGEPASYHTGYIDRLQIDLNSGQFRGSGIIGGYPFDVEGEITSSEWYVTKVTTYTKSKFATTYPSLGCAVSTSTTVYFVGITAPSTDANQVVGSLVTGNADPNGFFTAKVSTSFFGVLQIDGSYNDRDGTFHGSADAAGLQIKNLLGNFGNGQLYTTGYQMRCSPNGFPYPKVPDYRSIRYYFRICGQINQDRQTISGDGIYKGQDVRVRGDLTNQPGGVTVQGTVSYGGRSYRFESPTTITSSLHMFLTPTVDGQATSVWGYFFENYFVMAGYFNSELR